MVYHCIMQYNKRPIIVLKQAEYPFNLKYFECTKKYILYRYITLNVPKFLINESENKSIITFMKISRITVILEKTNNTQINFNILL